MTNEILHVVNGAIAKWPELPDKRILTKRAIASQTLLECEAGRSLIRQQGAALLKMIQQTISDIIRFAYE